MSEVSPPDSVLVLRFSAVGDLVLTAPALEALKTAWPKTRVLFAVKARLAHLVQHNPNVDEVLAVEAGDSAFSLARRAKGVGAVLDLHDKIRSKLVRLALPGARVAVWTQRDFRDVLPVKLALRPYRAQQRIADRYHAAVEELVGRQLPHGKLRYWLGPDDRRLADEALAAAGVDERRPLLGLSPGANWQTKQWPAERYGELARRALEQGWQVAVAGSADEAPLGKTIQSIAPGTVDVSGQLDLRGLGGFISRCAAFVANDSGPMHLARALGVPTLALFGSTDPAMFSWEGHARLFKEALPCAPCSFHGRRRCPKGHFRCMLDLDADAAWNALAPLMDRKPRAPVTG